MKKFIILFLLFTIARSCLASSDTTIMLDTIYDEYISVKDPRIGSIILVNKNNTKTYAQIFSNGLDGQIIAQNLSQIFTANKVNYELINESTLSPRTIKIKIMKSEN